MKAAFNADDAVLLGLFLWLVWRPTTGSTVRITSNGVPLPDASGSSGGGDPDRREREREWNGYLDEWDRE